MDRNDRRNSTQTKSRYTPFFHDMTRSAAWAGLSGTAVKVLMALLSQLYMTKTKKGIPIPKNNGDLSAGPAMMQMFGGPSKNAVTKAIRELEQGGFIIKTMRRTGGTQPNLYAVTCFPISHMENKPFIKSTRTASRDYLD